ncbi:MAG: DUF2851 family protein [Ignavibacterium sp.]|jgi:hypothetical protein
MGEIPFREKFLRHVWSKKSLCTAGLSTSDNLPLEILDPGVLNEGSGPDFRDARVRIGSVLYAGDVEIHRNVAEWMQHGHQNDPAYNRVILHVVFEGDPLRFPTLAQSGRPIPVLMASDFLLDSLQTVLAHGREAEEKHGGRTIPCAGRTAGISAHLLESWIGVLSEQRLEFKIRRFEERLRELAFQASLSVLETSVRYDSPGPGDPDEVPLPEISPRDFASRKLWDQVLYEGIMDGLGYSRNRKPFVRLAHSATLEVLRSHGILNDPVRTEAVLFGIAGMLPRTSDLSDGESTAYARLLYGHWNAVSHMLSCARLDQADWSRSPVRPANTPVFRIAAAARIVRTILHNDLFRSIIQSFKTAENTRALIAGLLPSIAVRAEGFWERHYDFNTPVPRTGSLVGTSRALDIVANAFLPLVLLYARLFHDRSLRANTLRMHQSFPSLSDNAVLRLMKRRLTEDKVLLKTLRLQQGTLQLYHHYCTEARCGECPVGKIVFSE